MSRTFKTVDYEKTLELTVRLRDALPAGHLARFIVDLVAHLDLAPIYARYAPLGGEAYAPEILLGLLVYGYVTGVFSSRKIERATHDSLPFRFIAGDLHPDHDTLANFRKTFLTELPGLFVDVLLLAQEAGVFKLGNVSVDGSKVHADASKSSAMSHKRLLEQEANLRREVLELFTLAERADQQSLPAGLVLSDEIAIRQDRLARLAQAKAVLATRADERYQAEKAAYDAKMQEREQKARRGGRHKPRGAAPKPPTPGPRDDDQYNFTDPDSRIMKTSKTGFEQSYNAQVAVDQASLLIVGQTLSNHPNDQKEAVPTVDAIPAALGRPPAAALDNGYFGAPNVAAFEARGIEPYIATGREPHHQTWQERFLEQPAPPSEDASLKEKMAYKLQTAIGKAIYGLRKCTVEPVIGIIKEVLGFRQFSLRGLTAVAGEWCLVCLAFNIKRLHVLLQG
ncbi:MAG: IS1182 family transposase [Chloroflexota bacterium]|nr:IS1182 family transposase [Chloroflexota bacterium]